MRESDSVELKAQWTERALEDLAAFANHRGGTVILGIADDGTVTGFAPGDQELQAIANRVSDTLGIRPRIRTERRRGKRVLAIRVEPNVIPVPCRGRYLVRVGTVNREMAPERVLENLELVREGRLTRGGVLLFGKDPLRACPTAETHIGRFKGNEIEDDRMVGGNLWEQLEAAMAAFRTYLQKRVEVKVTELTLEGLQNRPVWEYPLDALREAVINALIHRDYTALGNVEVRVYEDSIFIRSPGGLPHGMTVARLRDPNHPSQPRNPLLARAFFLADFIERWGAGTTKIIQLCRAQGLPEPEFVDEGGAFTVTFRKDMLTPERLQRMGLSERQITVVAHVRTHGLITNAECQKLVGVSQATATRDLEALVRQCVLVRHGRTGRGTRYSLKTSGRPQRPHEDLKKASRKREGRGRR